MADEHTRTARDEATGRDRSLPLPVVAALAALAGFAAVYVTLGRPDNVRSAAPVAVPAATPAGDGRLNVGEMAAFVARKAPAALEPIAFKDRTGADRSLADWRGKVVLLNLWATWCLPCRKEMPALDRLQAALGSDRFEVVAVSVDRTGLEGARKFLDGIKIEKLALYADPAGRLGFDLKVIGMPTTLLIDAEGREVGRLAGAAEWDSEDAKRLIRSVMK